MRKIVFYIGFLFLIFNQHVGFCAEVVDITQNKVEETIKEPEAPADLVEEDGVYSVRNFVAPVKENEEIKEESGWEDELIKVFITPLLADKLFEGEKINGDMSGFLMYMFPKIDMEHIDMYAGMVRETVKWKRTVEYVKARLKHQVKAAGILPKDAPIVAEDGEYAPEFSDMRKKTPEGQYEVRYRPYKYLEYDRGELGEPVRRRDKNYIGRSEYESDELKLALIEFDIKGIVKALQNMRRFYDGSEEKFNEPVKGVKARILLDTARPGTDKKTINAVIDIILPKGYFINGDYMNPAVKPKFVLTEDDDNGAENVTGYRLYYPLATGVDDNGVTRRVLTGRVRYPISFERADVNKPMRIAGKFGFMLCENVDNCYPVTVDHEITLKPSVRYEGSIFQNYIMQGFANIAQERSKNVTVDKVIYDKQKQKLLVRFNSDKVFSNVAVMAEDGKGGNFVNPRYQINKETITAEFDVNAVGDIDKLAISARFNESETLRAVVMPETAEILPKAVQTHIINKVNGWKAFFLGMLLNLMPGVFYLFMELIRLIAERRDRLKVLGRYMAATAAALILARFMFKGMFFGALYGNKLLLCAAGAALASYIAAACRYMDFALFRPFRKVVKQGIVLGGMTVVLMLAMPFAFKNDVMSDVFLFEDKEAFITLAYLWAGMMFLPIGGFFAGWRLAAWNKHLLNFNIVYSLLGLLTVSGLVLSAFGVWACVLFTGFTAGIWRLWYYYPLALNEVSKHIRKKAGLFATYDRVERHWTILFFAAIGIMWAVMIPFDVKTEKLPDSAVIKADIAKRIAEEKAVLVTINADYAPMSWLNKPTLNKLKKGGVQVYDLKVEALSEDKVKDWFDTFGQKKVPLSVLFTKRHPYGLLLPQTLSLVDFNTATQGFYVEE